MHHLIKPTSSMICAVVILMTAGCGKSNAEQLAKEKEQQRLAAEEQAIRDLQKANKAITENNKKLGRKPPEMDLGLPPAEKKPEAGAAAPPKP